MANNIIQQFNSLFQGLKDSSEKQIFDLLRQIVTTQDTNINNLIALEASDTQLLKLFAHVYKSTLTTVTNSSNTTISFDKTKYNYGMMFDSTKSDRITIPYTGIYTINVGVVWDSNATGNRTCQLLKNGSGYRDVIVPACSGIQTALAISITDLFFKGDYLQLSIFQSSGGNLTITVLTDRSLYMHVNGLYLVKQ